MAKAYIRCAKCSEFQVWTEAFTLNLERNSSCNVVPHGKYNTYLCSKCATELMSILGYEEEENGEETED